MSFSIVVSNPLDLLSHVPELVGFEPRRSLVLVALSSGVTCGTLRVDLPREEGPPPDGSGPVGAASTEAGLVDYASTVVGMLCRIRGADEFVPIVVTDATCASGTPRAALFTELRGAAAAAGFTVRDALFVASDGWGRAGCTPRPREELDAAWRLRRLDPDAAPVRLPPADDAALADAGEAKRRRTAEALAALRVERRTPDPVWFAEYSAHWPSRSIGPTSAALAARVLCEPWARDVVLFTWSWGRAVGLRALRFQKRFLRGAVLDDEQVAGALAGMGGIGRPSVEGLEGGMRVLREVAALLPETERPPCLASLGWLSWALGRGSLAGEYVASALDIDPRYGLAELVQTMVEHGALPEWAFNHDRARP
jgi:hypothetical protein